MFTESCLFDLKDEDQHDVNKLFGFSIGYHHYTSFRFGWRPILKNKTIQIVVYEYHEGVRMATLPICELNLNQWYDFKLKYSQQQEKTFYDVNGFNFSNDVILEKKFGWGYTLGVYFGGNEKAPQKIIIYRK